MLRPPAVAGQFYPDSAEELTRQVRSFCAPSAKSIVDESKSAPQRTPQRMPQIDPRIAQQQSQPQQRRAIACMVPHAGYRFSGHVAGAVYAQLAAQLDLPRRLVLLGPRHRPPGAAQAILSEGAWQTPLGRAEIDAELAAALKRACPALTEDAVAHRQEHALEVQLPFLQHLLGDGFRFVPIALGTIDYAALSALGRAIAEVIAQQPERVLIIASSDMNHYEPDLVTRAKDRLALDAVLALDARALHDVVRREHITMCGVGPAVSMLTAARGLGATRAELIRYATSGDINGDRDEVVGYAGLIVE